MDASSDDHAYAAAYEEKVRRLLNAREEWHAARRRFNDKLRERGIDPSHVRTMERPGVGEDSIVQATRAAARPFEIVFTDDDDYRNERYGAESNYKYAMRELEEENPEGIADLEKLDNEWSHRLQRIPEAASKNERREFQQRLNQTIEWLKKPPVRVPRWWNRRCLPAAEIQSYSDLLVYLEKPLKNLRDFWDDQLVIAFTGNARAAVDNACSLLDEWGKDGYPLPPADFAASSPDEIRDILRRMIFWLHQQSEAPKIKANHRAETSKSAAIADACGAVPMQSDKTLRVSNALLADEGPPGNDDAAVPSNRPCAARDATFLNWSRLGMTPAKIRDRWNNGNPAAKVGVGDAGREVVKKGIIAAKADEKKLQAK